MLLEGTSVLMHPFVAGEIACGSLSDRPSGIGYVDVHLLASVALSDGAQLWTRDKRLRAVADDLGCAYAGAGAR